MRAAGIATIERMSIKENHLLCDASPTPMALMIKGMMTALSDPGIIDSATFLNSVSLSRSLESLDALGIIMLCDNFADEEVAWEEFVFAVERMVAAAHLTDPKAYHNLV